MSVSFPKASFGVRRQSEAATALWFLTYGRDLTNIQSGVAATLCHRTPKKSPNHFLIRDNGSGCKAFDVFAFSR
jgi:hypothetical protein